MLGWLLCLIGRHDFYRSPWGDAICMRPCCSHVEQLGMFEYRVSLIRIVDGDTLHLDFDLGRYVHVIDTECRLAGVDAPEMKARHADPDGLGEEAQAAVKAWFQIHAGPYTAHTVKDTSEKYGRFLVDRLTAGGDGHELIADQLIAGWLRPYTGRGPHPW